MKPISAAKKCDPRLVAGFASFFEHVTPSHTITSRRYSMWGLVREHIDRPFEEALSDYPEGALRAFVAEFVPSSAWKPPGRVVLEIASSCQEAALPRLQSTSEERSRAELVVSALMQWDECLRLVVRRAKVSPNHEHFAATLDSIRKLLSKLRSLRPRHERDAEGTSVRDAISRPDQDTFCELCWRESLRAAALRSGQSKLRARGLSSRFCAIHDPRDPKSRYRADLRYKPAFERELDSLMNLDKSAYFIRFEPPRSADFQEIRKTAYDLVHSRLRQLDSTRPGLREHVAELLGQGLSQSDVGRKLGISRQAVSKAKKSLERVLRARALDAELSPRTGESLALSGPAGTKIRDQVRSMRKDGIALTEIASQLGRSRHSLEFLL